MNIQEILDIAFDLANCALTLVELKQPDAVTVAKLVKDHMDKVPHLPMHKINGVISCIDNEDWDGAKERLRFIHNQLFVCLMVGRKIAEETKREIESED
jgi:hypothetical protein